MQDPSYARVMELDETGIAKKLCNRGDAKCIIGKIRFKV